VVQVQAGATVRYSLLETIRQFAAARLPEFGEETATHLRLLWWALDVARSAEAALASAEWPAWASRLSGEQANIRAALSWALGGHEPEAGRELAARLARWWIATGRYSEGGRFLGTALSIGDAAAPHLQARMLLGAAWSAYNLGDASRAARLAGDGLACAQQAGEPQLEAWGRNLLAGLAWYAGDAGRVRALLESSTGRLEDADRALAARAHVLLARSPPIWPATWPNTIGTVSAPSSSPGPRPGRKASLSPSQLRRLPPSPGPVSRPPPERCWTRP
jgi:hypothetical protein